LLTVPAPDLLPLPPDYRDQLVTLGGLDIRYCPDCGAPLQRRSLPGYRWPARRPDSS
jgi:hypothetical protein